MRIIGEGVHLQSMEWYLGQTAIINKGGVVEKRVYVMWLTLDVILYEAEFACRFATTTRILGSKVESQYSIYDFGRGARTVLLSEQSQHRFLWPKLPSRFRMR